MKEHKNFLRLLIYKNDNKIFEICIFGVGEEHQISLD